MSTSALNRLLTGGETVVSGGPAGSRAALPQARAANHDERLVLALEALAAQSAETAKQITFLVATVTRFVTLVEAIREEHCDRPDGRASA